MGTQPERPGLLIFHHGSAPHNRSGDGGPYDGGPCVVTEGDLRSRVRRHLKFIYPDAPLDSLVSDVLDTIGLGGTEPVAGSVAGSVTEEGPRWDQRAVAVITYADSITEAGKPPMQTMHDVLDDLTGDVATVVHVLPFYPASSDGGFAITDHRSVDPRLGDWDDITDLSQTYTVMADLVVNHVSADHPWVKQFCSGEEPGSRYLLTAEPSDELSSVVRPRTTPLLRSVETPEGPRLLWCTFSYDQVDVDFAEPEVLLDLLRTVACLLDAGVRWFRLDAVAYLWKELGTSCVNLPQTHEVVKLLRTLLDARCPGSVIITETNVPHSQNIAYWGEGDEAHLVYNFSLPPLVAHTMLSGSSATMQHWLSQLEAPPAGTSFFNFIASHDGIGLRPAEGLLSEAEINRLIAASHSAGGTHSEFETPAGPKAYELNVSLWDLLAGDSDPLGVAQYLAAHTVMLSLVGIPALYVHTLLGTPSYWTPIGEPPRIVTEHGLPPVERNSRTINRRKLTLDEAVGLLGAQDGIRRRVLVELMRRTLIRCGQPAFHPDSPQVSLDLGDRVLGLMRGDARWGQTVVSVTNVSHVPLTVDLELLSSLCPPGSVGTQFAEVGCVDLLEGALWGPSDRVDLAAAQTMWLCLETERREPAPIHGASAKQ